MNQVNFTNGGGSPYIGSNNENKANEISNFEGRGQVVLEKVKYANTALDKLRAISIEMSKPLISTSSNAVTSIPVIKGGVNPSIPAHCSKKVKVIPPVPSIPHTSVPASVPVVNRITSQTLNPVVNRENQEPSETKRKIDTAVPVIKGGVNPSIPTHCSKKVKSIPPVPPVPSIPHTSVPASVPVVNRITSQILNPMEKVDNQEPSETKRKIEAKQPNEARQVKNPGEETEEEKELSFVKLMAQLVQVVSSKNILRVKNTSDQVVLIDFCEEPMSENVITSESEEADKFKKKNRFSKVLIEANKYVIYHTKKDQVWVNGCSADKQFWQNRRVQLYSTKLVTLTVSNEHTG